MIASIKAAVEANIAQHGIHIYLVGDFMYTIGNTRIGAPELYARCTPENTSAINAIFNGLHGRARAGAMEPMTIKCDGDTYTLRVPLDAAHLKGKMLGAAQRYGDFEVLELVAPCAHPFGFVKSACCAICQQRVMCH
jgi:hypothetical protein|eukprot:5605874-Prymnesium_polylepis.3